MNMLYIIIRYFLDPWIPLFKKLPLQAKQNLQNGLQFERKTPKDSWVLGASDTPENDPNKGQRVENKITWPFSSVVCFFLSSFFIPLIVSHPFSSDFLLISGTCVFAEGVVSPRLLVPCPPPLPNFPIVSLCWRLWVTCILSYTNFSLEGVLGDWARVCACMGAGVLSVSVCLIQGVVSPRGQGQFHIA